MLAVASPVVAAMLAVAVVMAAADTGNS